jgi:Putative phage abortive infection protein
LAKKNRQKGFSLPSLTQKKIKTGRIASRIQFGTQCVLNYKKMKTGRNASRIENMNFFKKHFIILIIVLLSVLIIGTTMFAYWKNDFLDPNYYLGTDKLGHFGDFIGGFLGTILTIVATVYIYKTYMSQKEELESQRKLISQQQFESTFFNLLNIHIDIKKNLRIDFSEANFKPADYSSINKLQINDFEVFSDVRQFITYMYFRIIKSIVPIEEIFEKNNTHPEIQKTVNDFSKLSDLDKEDEGKRLSFIFKIIFPRYQNQISHYCRNVYHILKFIRENESQNKNINYKKYSDILQSQLNVDEQFILFYNFIIFDVNDNDEYLHPINIVNHYKFLENLGSNNLLDKELHNNKKFYSFEIK